MNNRLKACIQRIDPAAIAFAAIPALLYLPVFYYSLDTPFALVDHYVEWVFLRIFDHFNHWLYAEFVILGRSQHWLDVEYLGRHWENFRYRPFWEFYIGATWKVFGTAAWLHHLARWAEHFAAVAAFAAAYLCFQRRNKRNGNGDGATSSRLIRLLPLAALVYLWLFFPNQPAARLQPNEVHTVFFLGLCVWMTALMLSRQDKPQSRRAALLAYAAFCVGFCGLAWTKEVNIAAALWLLLSYYALPVIAALRRQAGPRISAVRALKGVGVWTALGGLPLIAVFAHTLAKVYAVSQAGNYGVEPVTLDLLARNAAWLAADLFQVRTSPIIAVGLALLSAALPLSVAVNIAKRRFSAELVFTLFLLGIFASLYLALCASWAQALRYWYILIPAFTTLMAFSAKFILESAAARFNSAPNSPAPPNLAAYALTAFIAFFVCCNYYNFLYQTAVQHIARHNDQTVLAEITRLLEQGNYVQITDARYVYGYELVDYYREFLPYFYGRKRSIHSAPPQETAEPYHTVRLFRKTSRLPEIEQNYRPLAYAYRIADFLQAGAPYHKIDVGSNILLWHIYANDGNRIWWNGETLDVQQIVSDADNPLIRSDFDVYLNNRLLIYIKERCNASDIDNTFFLAAFPVHNADLPEDRRPHGFANLDFDFTDYGFGGGERCIAARDLPAYPIERIHTGQLVPVEDGYHHIWEGNAVLSNE